jgi:hypothetical protein
MGQTNPASDGLYHRFPPDFWEKVGYSRIALPDNRLGRLAEGQQIFFIGDAFRVVVNVVIVLGAMFGLLGVVTNRAHFNSGGFLTAVGLLLAFAAAFGFFTIIMLRNLNRDRVRREVVSFCGELTRWIVPNDEGLTDDLHGLEHQSHRVHTTAKAWSALPDRARYRIYFTPRSVMSSTSRNIQTKRLISGRELRDVRFSLGS